MEIIKKYKKIECMNNECTFVIVTDDFNDDVIINE